MTVWEKLLIAVFTVSLVVGLRTVINRWHRTTHVGSFWRPEYGRAGYRRDMFLAGFSLRDKQLDDWLLIRDSANREVGKALSIARGEDAKLSFENGVSPVIIPDRSFRGQRRVLVPIDGQLNSLQITNRWFGVTIAGSGFTLVSRWSLWSLMTGRNSITLNGREIGRFATNKGLTFANATLLLLKVDVPTELRVILLVLFCGVYRHSSG
jgi:hypothetical protein